MICPNCNADIQTVKIFTQNVSIGILVGNTICNCRDLDKEYVNTLGIECPECNKDLTKWIHVDSVEPALKTYRRNNMKYGYPWQYV